MVDEIRGDRSFVPQGGMIPRAEVPGGVRTTPQEIHAYNPVDWARALIDSQASDVQSMGIPLRTGDGSVATTIYISPNQEKFIKEGQSKDPPINYTVSVGGKKYPLPVLN